MTAQPSALDVVAALVDGWQRRDADAIAGCFAEDGVWHNMPHAPIVGRPAIGAAIGRFLGSVTRAEFRIHHIAEIAPGIVVTERNDLFAMADGRAIDIPVMGIFEIADGAVRAWRDYFDPVAMTGSATV